MLHCNSIDQLPALKWFDAFHYPELPPNVRLSAHPSSLSSFSPIWKLPIQASAAFSPHSSRGLFWYQWFKKKKKKIVLCYRDNTYSPPWQPIYLQSKFIANQVTRASISSTYHALQVLSDKHLTSAVFWNARHFSTATEVRLCYGWLAPEVLFLQVGTDDLRTVNIKELSRQQSQRDV